jgi:UDPglucose--hexose-1-phosphate uridylyltransferase
VADFQFLQNRITGKWVISAPHRAKRPDDIHEDSACPFCPIKETIVYESGEVKVLNNKFPFAPIHEVIIHSKDHNRNFEELTGDQVKLIFETFRQRFQTHKNSGRVYIFHNRGERAGESLVHPHSQLVVVPNKVELDIQPLDRAEIDISSVETTHFYIFCPSTSEWPEEVWIAPKIPKLAFGRVSDEEIVELSQTVTKLIKIFQNKHGQDFAYNFYIYPGDDWYLRFIPRKRILGGFELGTYVSVNTHDPKETLEFLKSNFNS